MEGAGTGSRSLPGADGSPAAAAAAAAAVPAPAAAAQATATAYTRKDWGSALAGLGLLPAPTAGGPGPLAVGDKAAAARIRAAIGAHVEPVCAWDRSALHIDAGTAGTGVTGLLALFTGAAAYEAGLSGQGGCFPKLLYPSLSLNIALKPQNSIMFVALGDEPSFDPVFNMQNVQSELPSAVVVQHQPLRCGELLDQTLLHLAQMIFGLHNVIVINPKEFRAQARPQRVDKMLGSAFFSQLFGSDVAISANILAPTETVLALTVTLPERVAIDNLTDQFVNPGKYQNDAFLAFRRVYLPYFFCAATPDQVVWKQIGEDKADNWTTRHVASLEFDEPNESAARRSDKQTRRIQLGFVIDKKTKDKGAGRGAAAAAASAAVDRDRLIEEHMKLKAMENAPKCCAVGCTQSGPTFPVFIPAIAAESRYHYHPQCVSVLVRQYLTANPSIFGAELKAASLGLPADTSLRTDVMVAAHAALVRARTVHAAELSARPKHEIHGKAKMFGLQIHSTTKVKGKFSEVPVAQLSDAMVTRELSGELAVEQMSRVLSSAATTEERVKLLNDLKLEPSRLSQPEHIKASQSAAVAAAAAAEVPDAPRRSRSSRSVKAEPQPPTPSPTPSAPIPASHPLVTAQLQTATGRRPRRAAAAHAAAVIASNLPPEPTPDAADDDASFATPPTTTSTDESSASGGTAESDAPGHEASVDVEDDDFEEPMQPAPKRSRKRKRADADLSADQSAAAAAASAGDADDESPTAKRPKRPETAEERVRRQWAAVLADPLLTPEDHEDIREQRIDHSVIPVIEKFAPQMRPLGLGTRLHQAVLKVRDAQKPAIPNPKFTGGIAGRELDGIFETYWWLVRQRKYLQSVGEPFNMLDEVAKVASTSSTYTKTWLKVGQLAALIGTDGVYKLRDEHKPKNLEKFGSIVTAELLKEAMATRIEEMRKSPAGEWLEQSGKQAATRRSTKAKATGQVKAEPKAEGAVKVKLEAKAERKKPLATPKPAAAAAAAKSVSGPPKPAAAAATAKSAAAKPAAAAATAKPAAAKPAAAAATAKSAAAKPAVESAPEPVFASLPPAPAKPPAALEPIFPSALPPLSFLPARQPGTQRDMVDLTSESRSSPPRAMLGSTHAVAPPPAVAVPAEAPKPAVFNLSALLQRASGTDASALPSPAPALTPPDTAAGNAQTPLRLTPAALTSPAPMPSTPLRLAPTTPTSMSAAPAAQSTDAAAAPAAAPASGSSS